MQIGDVLFEDMHIEHRPADGSKVKGSPAGIISYLADLNDEYTEGYIHGLVLAGKISYYTSRSWSYEQYTEEVADHPGLENCATVEQAMNDKSGLSNCLVVGRTESLGSLTTAHNTMIPLYDKATPWFIPSAGQWIKIICAWGGKITSPMNRSGHIDFEYESKIRPGTTSLFDDIKYLWTPFFAIAYNGDDAPAINKSNAYSSTEFGMFGYYSCMWLFVMPKSGKAPYAERDQKHHQSGKVWPAFAF